MNRRCYAVPAPAKHHRNKSGVGRLSVSRDFNAVKFVDGDNCASQLYRVEDGGESPIGRLARMQCAVTSTLRRISPHDPA